MACASLASNQIHYTPVGGARPDGGSQAIGQVEDAKLAGKSEKYAAGRAAAAERRDNECDRNNSQSAGKAAGEVCRWYACNLLTG
jgi:hypothetical protein